MNTLAPFVGGRPHVRFANTHALDVAVIGRQDHLEAAFEHRIEKSPKRSTLRPMSDAGMHPISAIDDAMQHLIDRADHNAGDAASRLIDLFNYPFDKPIVVFKRTLTGIDSVAFAEPRSSQNRVQCCSSLRVVSRLWPKKNGGSPAKID